jgi:hypothetical protein
LLVDNFGVVLEELLECAVPAGNGGKLARTTSLRFLGAPTTVGLRPLRQNLIAFDFTNFKFFQYLATEEHRRTIVSRWIIGMTMILIGLTGLALAWIQHRSR